MTDKYQRQEYIKENYPGEYEQAKKTILKSGQFPPEGLVYIRSKEERRG